MVDVTVLIPTYRRPELLTACLQGVLQLDDPGMSWEVIVVDNDPPGARAAIERFRATSPVPVRYVEEPRPGAAHARNRGIAEADGELIAMLDDDVVPDRAWLREVLVPMQAGEAEATAGTVILDPTVPRPSWFHEEELAKYLAHFEAPDRYMELGDYILTANAAWQIEPLRRTGGFDASLGPRQGVPMVNDDVFVANQLLRQGGRIRFVPGARVTHAFPAERLRARYVIRRLYAQGRSDWILNRPEYESRPLHGLSRAVRRLQEKLGQARSEGLFSRSIAFFALCEVVYTLGAFREGVRWWFQRSPAGEPGTHVEPRE